MPETQGSSSAPDILQRIVETKGVEIQALLSREDEIRDRLRDAPAPLELASALERPGEVAVMAEVKRRSPGAGAIRPELDPAELARAYQGAGAAAVSVLTDREYFGGSMEDLGAVRKTLSIPVFRKEFILHPLQLLEARAWGADGTLLIARILPDQLLGELHDQAMEVGLTPLVEVHDVEELDRALAVGARVLGINNRNLRTFRTTLEVTLRLLGRLPPGAVVVSESGIRTAAEVDRLGAAGVEAILVGETFLRAPDPGAAAAELVGRRRSSREAPGA